MFLHFPTKTMNTDFFGYMPHQPFHFLLFLYLCEKTISYTIVARLGIVYANIKSPSVVSFSHYHKGSSIFFSQRMNIDDSIHYNQPMLYRYTSLKFMHSPNTLHNLFHVSIHFQCNYIFLFFFYRISLLLSENYNLKEI